MKPLAFMQGRKRPAAALALMLLGIALSLLAFSYARESAWWSPVMLVCGVFLGTAASG